MLEVKLKAGSKTDIIGVHMNIEGGGHTLERVKDWFQRNGSSETRAHNYAEVLRIFYLNDIYHSAGNVDINIFGVPRNKGNTYLPATAILLLRLPDIQELREQRKFPGLDEFIISSLHKSDHVELRIRKDFLETGAKRETSGENHLGVLNYDESTMILVPPGWSQNANKYVLGPADPDNLDGFRESRPHCPECAMPGSFYKLKTTTGMDGNKNATAFFVYENIPVFSCEGCQVQFEDQFVVGTMMSEREAILRQLGIQDMFTMLQGEV